jgi:hypothetical protein
MVVPLGLECIFTFFLPNVHPYGIMKDNDYGFFYQTFIPTGFFSDGVHQRDSAAFVRRYHRIADAVERSAEDLFERILFVICFVRHWNIFILSDFSSHASMCFLFLVTVQRPLVAPMFFARKNRTHLEHTVIPFFGSPVGTNRLVT